jgi:hypothetical protein
VSLQQEAEMKFLSVVILGIAFQAAATADEAVTAPAPVMEKGKFVTAHSTDVGKTLAFGMFSKTPVRCVYKGPSGQTWEEVMPPPCHSFATHEVPAKAE